MFMRCLITRMRCVAFIPWWVGGFWRRSVERRFFTLIQRYSLSADLGELECGVVSCSLIILHASLYVPAQVTCKLFEVYCSLLNIAPANPRCWVTDRWLITSYRSWNFSKSDAFSLANGSPYWSNSCWSGGGRAFAGLLGICVSYSSGSGAVGLCSSCCCGSCSSFLGGVLSVSFSVGISHWTNHPLLVWMNFPYSGSWFEFCHQNCSRGFILWL